MASEKCYFVNFDHHIYKFCVTIQFARLEDARAAQSLNGQLEIAGRMMKVQISPVIVLRLIVWMLVNDHFTLSVKSAF